MNETLPPSSPSFLPAAGTTGEPVPWASVVIPLRNCRASIGKTLDGLMRQRVSGPCELILSRDIITDDTLEIIYAHPLASAWKVVEICHPGRGYGQACNLGWKIARAKYIFFVHSDCYPVSNDTMQQQVDCLERESAVAVKPLVGIPTGDWEAMSFWDKVTSSQHYRAKPDHNLMGKFDLIRRDALAQVGGFDEEHFYSAGEDADLAERLLTIGKISAADTLVIHAHLHPPDAQFKAALRKHTQTGEGSGAVFRKHWHSPGFLHRAWTIVGVNLLKLVLLVGIFIPPVSLYAAILMLLLATYYGRWAMLSRDWRVVLVPFAVSLMFAFFAVGMVRAFIRGRQSFDYIRAG